MTTPRRQRWLEPQARLMNAGVSFPSSSVQEFYSYGGSGGFGLPFIAPPWGFASNYTSSSSHTVSSTSNVVKPIVKSDVSIIHKEVEKTPEQIYEEKAFPDKRKVDKIANQIYDEEVFPDKPKAEMGRLSNIQRKIVKKLNDPILNEELKKGDEDEASGNKHGEGTHHRFVIDYLRKRFRIVCIDDDSSYAYKYNCLAIHNPWLVNIMTENKISINDAFYYSEKDKTYFLKDEYIDKFVEKKWIDKDTDDLIYSNFHKTDRPPIIYIKSFQDAQKHIAKLYESQYQPIESTSVNMTAEEYDRIAFK